jgi:hypothetical protein
MKIDRACFERGCACYDDRIDKDPVEVVKHEWVGLTDEEVADLGRHELWIKQFIRAIEAKLKEKNQ